jgi:hypothetical protein
VNEIGVLARYGMYNIVKILRGTIAEEGRGGISWEEDRRMNEN